MQKYFRSNCSDVNDANTINFTKQIAEHYGLTGDLADTVVLRVHAGTQYFQYIWSSGRVMDDIAYLQNQVDPNEKRRVDPYVLFACGLNTPMRDEKYVAKLKACLQR